jgi:predicted nucleic acid-binding protein
MTTVLLDTNIVSYLFKRDSRAALYAPHLLKRELAIAMMTVAELFQWAAIRNWGKSRMRRLEQHVERYTVLPVDIDLCWQWAEVRATRSRAGLPISPQDAWIAATALRYRLALVTHNPDDYQAIPGLMIISEA